VLLVVFINQEKIVQELLNQDVSMFVNMIQVLLFQDNCFQELLNQDVFIFVNIIQVLLFQDNCVQDSVIQKFNIAQEFIAQELVIISHESIAHVMLSAFT